MSTEPSPAQIIGHNVLLQELGRGGQGTVWLAEDQKLKRKVALKLLHAVGGVTRDRLHRFRREAEAASKLDHPNICGLLDAGEVDGTPYLAFRYVEGETLAERITRAFERQEGYVASEDAAGADPDPSNSQGIERIVALFEKTARALHKAHEQGLIHRDVKPSNLMITPDGEPVVLDFGLARDELAEEQSLTHSGDLLGTPAYMSPEQLVAQRIPLDRRTDVYSLGASLYEALTLQKPYGAPTRAELYQKILASDPSSASTLNRQIPRDLQVVLETVMEKDRNRRYQTALDFAEDLRRFREHESVRAKPVGRLLRLKRWAQRHPALAATTVGVLAALGLALWFLLETQVNLRHIRGIALAREAAAAQQSDQMLALLLALEAVRVDRTVDTLAVLHQAYAEARECATRWHEDRVSDVEFSPDGQRVLSGSLDGTARLWDLEGRELLPIHHKGGVTDVAFSPGGDIMTAAEGSAYLWDPRDVTDPKVTFSGQAAVSTVVSSTDGNYVLTACTDKKARLWNASGELRTTYEGALLGVVSAAFLQAGTHVVTASFDGKVRLYARDNPIPIRVMGHPEDALYEARASPDGQSILTASVAGAVRLMSLDGDLELLLPGHGGAVLSARMFEDGDAILTASADQKARLFDRSGKELMSLRRSGAFVESADRSPNGSLFVTGHEDGAVALWDANVPGAPVLLGHGGPVRTVAYSPDGDVILTADGSGRIILWTPEGRRLRSFGEPAEAGLLAATFSADGRQVLAGYWNGSVRGFDRNGKELWTLQASSQRVNAIDCRSDGSFLTAHGSDAVRVWSRNRKTLGEHAPDGGAFTFAIFASDGILAADLRGNVRLFRSDGGEALVLSHGARAMSAAESPDRRFLLTASSDRTARLWDRQGQEILRLQHEAAVIHAVFHPEGHRILTTSRDGIARMWDLEGNLVAKFQGHRGIVWRACFSPDGSRIVTGSLDHTARVWITDPKELIELAGQRVIREFTPAELVRYQDLLERR